MALSPALNVYRVSKGCGPCFLHSGVFYLPRPWAFSWCAHLGNQVAITHLLITNPSPKHQSYQMPSTFQLISVVEPSFRRRVLGFRRGLPGPRRRAPFKPRLLVSDGSSFVFLASPGHLPGRVCLATILFMEMCCSRSRLAQDSNISRIIEPPRNHFTSLFLQIFGSGTVWIAEENSPISRCFDITLGQIFHGATTMRLMAGRVGIYVALLAVSGKTTPPETQMTNKRRVGSKQKAHSPSWALTLAFSAR